MKFHTEGEKNNSSGIQKGASTSKARDRILYDAVLRGDLKGVMRAIKQGADVLQVDDQGRELIINAIVQPKSKCTPLILKVLIDPKTFGVVNNLSSTYGYMALGTSRDLRRAFVKKCFFHHKKKT